MENTNRKYLDFDISQEYSKKIFRQHFGHIKTVGEFRDCLISFRDQAAWYKNDPDKHCNCILWTKALLKKCYRNKSRLIRLLSRFGLISRRAREFDEVLSKIEDYGFFNERYIKSVLEKKPDIETNDREESSVVRHPMEEQIVQNMQSWLKQHPYQQQKSANRLYPSIEMINGQPFLREVDEMVTERPFLRETRQQNSAEKALIYAELDLSSSMDNQQKPVNLSKQVVYHSVEMINGQPFLRETEQQNYHESEPIYADPLDLRSSTNNYDRSEPIYDEPYLTPNNQQNSAHSFNTVNQHSKPIYENVNSNDNNSKKTEPTYATAIPKALRQGISRDGLEKNSATYKAESFKQPQTNSSVHEVKSGRSNVSTGEKEPTNMKRNNLVHRLAQQYEKDVIQRQTQNQTQHLLANQITRAKVSSGASVSATSDRTTKSKVHSAKERS